MHVISSISYDSKRDGFLVTINENEKLLISYEDFEKIEISEGKELSSREYSEIKKISSRQNAIHLAVAYASKRFTCSYKIQDYLVSKGYSKIFAEEIIELISNQKLFDDDLYLDNFIKSKLNLSLWSKKRIKFDLIRIGFKDSDIERYFIENDLSCEDETIKLIIEKKFSSVDLTAVKTRQKIFSNLYNKGFSSDAINRVLKENY